MVFGTALYLFALLNKKNTNKKCAPPKINITSRHCVLPRLIWNKGPSSLLINLTQALRRCSSFGKSWKLRYGCLCFDVEQPGTLQ